MTRPELTPFEIYVAPARPRAALWQTALGLCLIGLFYSAFLVLFIQMTRRFWTPGGAAGSMSTLVLLMSFAGMGLGVMVVTRQLHKRAIATLFGPAATVIRDFILAAFAVGAVFVLTLLFWAIEYDATPNLPLSAWLLVLPFGLIGIAVQTGAEELVFRGYLQQQLAARFRSPLIWMILPSLLFGSLHYDPENSGPNLWWIVIATGLFGLVAADLTARTGSLGAAWGLHFANNVAALLLLSTNGALSGMALFVTPYAVSDPMVARVLQTEIAALLVTWLLARLLLRR